jgi:hypothetical protein
LPRTIRTTTDLLAARETVRQLRRDGAVAVIMEDFIDDEIFCATHSAILATLRCSICGEKICRSCVKAAGGKLLCHTHGTIANNHQRLTRLRQLFLLFIFSAFLYQFFQYVQSDKDRTSPTGTVRVAVLQYVIGDARTPIIDQLNNPGSPFNIMKVQEWYNAERIRYGGSSDSYLEFSILPPTMMTTPLPMLSSDADSILMNMFSAWKYLRFFNRLAKEQINSEDYGVRIFIIYLGGEGDIASHSSGSEKGRLAIAHINSQEQNPAYALTTIAHELGHTLGALDSYDLQTFDAVHPAGFVEPFSSPLFPQRFAEVMAVDIPVSRTQEAEVTSLSQLRVGYQTAAQMQWITEDMADNYYAPPAQRPEDLLPLRRAARTPPSDSPGVPQDSGPANP